MKVFFRVLLGIILAAFLFYAVRVTFAQKKRADAERKSSAIKSVYADEGADGIYRALGISEREFAGFGGDASDYDELLNYRIYGKCLNSVVSVKSYSGDFLLAKGSGVVVSDSNTVLTNWHVVSGADRWVLTDSSGRNFKSVSLRSRDRESDLAILSVEGTTGWTPLMFSGSKPFVGMSVFSISFADGVNVFMSPGSIGTVASAVRDANSMIMAGMLADNCTVLSGSSGGALVNLKGELVGIDYSVYTDKNGRSISYALDGSLISPLVDRMISLSAKGVTEFSKGGLDIEAVDLTDELRVFSAKAERGVLVTGVTPGGNCDGMLRAGERMANVNGKSVMLGGDVIVSVNGLDICSVADIYTALMATSPGDQVEIRFYRGRDFVTAKATLSQRKSDYNTRFGYQPLPRD